ncbi:MAG: 50S ribosome-binding GTPase, partial [Candidatus Caldarchaeum sp.]|nr:50S ribosome-binding GTPase [Candidatus Caldarchaeum sp.]MDW8436297.1 FeoB small GTPase domain-containing protein [Candidatus Caldarchaeum sp.]
MGFIRYAITGPPNVGKSSLFVALTGVYVKTANYPGTTLEIHRGRIRNKDVEVTDLPGVLRPESPLDEDEKVAVAEIIGGDYDGVVVVAAPHSWTEALRLAKFASRYKPVVLVFNMVDVWKPPYTESELSGKISMPVVYVSAVKRVGVDKLAEILSRRISFSNPEFFELEVPGHAAVVSRFFVRPVPAMASILMIAFASVALLVSLVEGITPWGRLPLSINSALEYLETSVTAVIFDHVSDRIAASFLAEGVWSSAITLISIALYVFVALVLVVLYEE